MMGAKFKVGDRVTTNDTANVDIIQHWNDWFRGEHGEIVDGALVVASVSDKHIGLSNRAGAAHFYMPPSTLTIAPLTIRAGKLYRTRDGRKVGPAEVYTGHPYAGEGFVWRVGSLTYRDDGTVCWSKDEDDLISEWVDEPVAEQQAGAETKTVGEILDETLRWMKSIDDPEPHYNVSTAGFTVPVCSYEDEQADDDDIVQLSVGDLTAALADSLKVARKVGKTIKVGDRVVLTAPARIAGFDKRNANIVLDTGGSFALPIAALSAA